MRLPNGFGSVYKLSGNRRKPYVAQKTNGYDANNKRQYTIIGYYETKEEGLIALAEYNKNPYSLQPKMTFAEVYDKWSERKFENISRSNINGYKASYKICDKIKDLKMTDVKLSHLQGVVDNSGKNYPTLKKLKIMLNQIFDYAVQHDIISRDNHKVEFLDIGKATKSDKHYRFTDDEIKVLFKWAEKPDNIYIRLILMLIYSGVRPGELFNVKRDRVNLKERSFWIDRGKNDNAVRKVPIHDKVFSFFEQWYNKGNEYLITQLNGKNFRFDTNHGQYVDTYWKPILEEMGIYTYINDKGESKEHAPDDTRHTFTTMWHEKHLDEAMRRKIQGHSGKGIGEQVYSHMEFETLKTELNKL